MKNIITFTIWIAALSVTPVIGVAQSAFNFVFSHSLKTKGATYVSPRDIYDPVKGYGWERESLPDTSLASPAVKGTVRSTPLYFSVNLPEGNYDVKLVLGKDKQRAVATVKVENRRLMLEKVETAPGKTTTQWFTVHIRDSIIRPSNKVVALKPRERNYRHWDHKLTIELNNAAPYVQQMEVRKNNAARTIFLAGNSTVVDQPDEPWAAWGQMIPAFLVPHKIAVANYAESGETLKAFARERRLEKIWSRAKPGDYLFIEFTHNDQKPGGNHLDAFSGYKDTLRSWIAEAKARKVVPVLVTSMHRRSFDSTGKIENTLGDYPEAMRQVAAEEFVTLIDLNAMSKILYEAWGPERSLKAFVHFPANSFPDQPNELKDNTHFTAYGAYELARCVVMEIKRKIPELSTQLRKDSADFDPAKPMLYENWQLPQSSLRLLSKPDGN
ncbi:MAG: rhamnogalacturonan acetylesterase [Chitinophagaceae bacterium]